MNAYKVGDRVAIVSDPFHSGKTGTVIRASDDYIRIEDDISHGFITTLQKDARLEKVETPVNNVIATEPQEGDVNETIFKIGDRVQVTNIPVLATITRINWMYIWLCYDDGERGVAAENDCTKVETNAAGREIELQNERFHAQLRNEGTVTMKLSELDRLRAELDKERAANVALTARNRELIGLLDWFVGFARQQDKTRSIVSLEFEDMLKRANKALNASE